MTAIGLPIRINVKQRLRKREEDGRQSAAQITQNARIDRRTTAPTQRMLFGNEEGRWWFGFATSSLQMKSESLVTHNFSNQIGKLSESGNGLGEAGGFQGLEVLVHGLGRVLEAFALSLGGHANGVGCKVE